MTKYATDASNITFISEGDAVISTHRMGMVEEIKKYNEWYDLTVDSMRGIEAFTITELLQRAFSAGVKAAEQSREAQNENYK